MSLDVQGQFAELAKEPDNSGGGADVDMQMADHASWRPQHGAGGGYGAKAGPSATAVAVTVVVHAALFAALLQLGSSFVAEKAERLVSVDLQSPPPPPQQTEATPPAPRPDTATVETPIKLALPAPISVAVDPEPLPVPAISVQSVPQPEPAPPAPGPEPRMVESSDLGTRMIAGQPPRYPLESRRKREQGTVMLSVMLGTDGRVADIFVQESSGFPRLDRAALKAVRNWRWEPTLRGGKPVMVQGIVPIPFVLQGTA